MGFSRLLRLALADALEGTEVDEHVDQGVEVSDGPTVAQFGALDAQLDSLAVDAFGGGALAVDILVGLAGAVEFVAGACSWAEGQGGDAAALGPVLVADRAGLACGLGVAQGASIATAAVGEQAVRFLDEGGLEGHAQASSTEGATVVVELLAMILAVGPGHGGEALCLVEVLVDVEGVEGGIQSAELGFAPQTPLHLCHQGEEVGDVGLVEGLGEFGQDELTPAVGIGGHQARGIAPSVPGLRSILMSSSSSSA